MKNKQMSLREFRKSKGITQEKLGDMLGVGYSVICKYEKGKAKPSIGVMARIADISKGAVGINSFCKTTN